MMDWKNITRFNFTFAIPGGAWLEDASGRINWEAFSTIDRELGTAWSERMLKKQGWMTGCWVNVKEGA